MDDSTTRRGFLKTASTLAAGTLAGGVGGEILAADGAKATVGKMPQRVLGKTGVKVSILGAGADGILSDSTNKDAVLKFLTNAIDGGINFFDTAYIYGKDGRCDKNLGLIMGTPRRKGLFLATKTGGRMYDTAMRQIETSLKRLRVSQLDLIQVHHVSAKDDVKAFGKKTGVLTALRKLQDQKVVRFIGITGHSDAPQVKQALEMYEWDTLMCYVNPARFSWPALTEQLPAARKNKCGVIAMKTFGGRPGRLVGRGRGRADAATLLRFSMSQPTSVTLIGMSSQKQLAENLQTAYNFKPMNRQEAQSLYKQINSGAKPWKR
ncbi:MAG: aldo/keto reductase [Phycisphaerales bacterium]|nr:aldo/keto reductase [Phycisphaerales bacterium]